MRCHSIRMAALATCLLVGGQAQAEVDYSRDIKPLLASKCGACHGVLKQEAGLRLDASQLIRKGSENSPVVIAGDVAGSLIIQRVSAAEESDRMPPAGAGEPLKAEQIQLLSEWIAAGAPAPESEAAASDPRQHWSFRKPERPAIPSVPAGAAIGNPIDALLSARRQADGLTDVEPADPATLLRRVTFDLIGLPPTAEELQAFLRDHSETAYERVVDDLLSRPEHGERWGRHWMDVWRYSDWDGFGDELRGSQKHIWHWRDWTIESLNADRPYDQMVREMLAGDEMAPTDPDVLRATGFLTRDYYKFNRQMWLDTVVEHTGKAFLGLTLNCAKCHDHKFDPLAQRDYYRFQAIFAPYNVRLDRRESPPDLAQDGLSRAFDAEPDAATYLLTRGDERNPDRSAVIEPGFPAVFDVPFAAVPVDLPPPAFAPYVDGPELEFLRTQARSERLVAQQKLSIAESQQSLAEHYLAELSATSESADAAATPAALSDDFAALDDAQWAPAAGEWEIVPGGLKQSRVAAETCRLVSRRETPADFSARFEFQILGGQTYHSVGLSFDRVDDSNYRSVYLSACADGPKVQISSTRNGATSYPAEGLRALPIEIGSAHVLDVRVRGSLVNVRVDGQLVVAYQLEGERAAGRFAVWSFDSQAEFRAVSVCELRADAVLAKSLEQAELFAPTVELAAATCAKLGAAAATARRKLAAVEADERLLECRLAADRALFGMAGEGEDATVLAREASQAQKTARILNAESALAAAQSNLEAATAARKENDAASVKAAVDAGEAVAGAQAQLAQSRMQSVDGRYDHPGTVYPRASTGRRTALARWITSRDNPLTARVAVNHLWLRHFGRPLVANTFDFGLRSPLPRHADVLDWLAVELMDHQWSMKRIHRLIVTSRTYRMASGPAGEATSAAWAQNRARDRDNLDYWCADVRRLDAEAVRDAVLQAAGSLDSTEGGPDIDFSEGEQNPRRSVYFRHAYEKQMRFLTTFDAASPNECYRRSESIIPHQALAMSNSRLTLVQSRTLAARLWTRSQESSEPEAAFISACFETILSRPPSAGERDACATFLMTQRERLSDAGQLTAFGGGEAVERPASADPAQRARENLAHVLFNHNDFVSIR